MSIQSTGDSQAQEALELKLLVQLVTINYIVVYGLISAIALLLYDLVLCLGQERCYIWKKKVTLTTVLYILARYGPVLSTIFYFVDELLGVYYSIHHPLPFSIIIDIVETLNLISVQGLLGIRLYAVLGGKKVVLCVLISLYVIEFGLGVAEETVNVPKIYQVAPLYIKVLTNSTNASVIVFDTVVFLGTIYNIHGTWKLQREVGSENRSITDIIVRQGLLRYILVVILSIVPVVLQRSVNFLITTIASTFERALSTLIVCRLTLELRERYEAQIDEVALPTLSWSIESVRQGAQYVHNTIIAEAAGEFGSYVDDPMEES